MAREYNEKTIACIRHLGAICIVYGFESGLVGLGGGVGRV